MLFSSSCRATWRSFDELDMDHPAARMATAMIADMAVMRPGEVLRKLTVFCTAWIGCPNDSWMSAITGCRVRCSEVPTLSSQWSCVSSVSGGPATVIVSG